MYNLRKMRGLIKGNVGETLFLSLNRYAHPAHYDNHAWLDKVPFHLDEKHKIFLRTYWSTIDAFEFIVKDNAVENIIFYEIKTLNHYTEKGVNCGYLPTISHHAHQFYRRAMKNGYRVKSVYVIFFLAWYFDISIRDYDETKYQIHDGNPAFAKQI